MSLSAYSIYLGPVPRDCVLVPLPLPDPRCPPFGLSAVAHLVLTPHAHQNYHYHYIPLRCIAYHYHFLNLMNDERCGALPLRAGAALRAARSGKSVSYLRTVCSRASTLVSRVVVSELPFCVH